MKKGTALLDGSERSRNIPPATGLQYKEIASELGISQRTVETYKRNIFHKMGAENTVEVVLFALRNGLVNL